MKNVGKFAFFVEGLTELLFIELFLKSLLPSGKYAIQSKQMKGGKNRVITATINRDDEPLIDTSYYFLLIDCNGEGNIRSYIDAECESLINADYKLIVGITDLYPMKYEEYSKKKFGHLYNLQVDKIPIKIIIAVMETEAWFLADYSHFEKIHSSLTPEKIYHQTNIDLKTADVESTIEHPAKQLNEIYQIAGKFYKKRKRTLSRTINNLNYEYIYFEMPKRVPSLAELVQVINQYIILS